MTDLELLAPARNADIGIAAIDCGADAVYIAGPAFGARKAAGNPMEDIARLCAYARRYGARVFVTFNISVDDEELPDLHSQMLQAQEAGADAFIIRDPRICCWMDIHVPLHASTQCAIRDVQTARRYAGLGCGRIVLERELSLPRIREICRNVDCEVECFVHGALCVCYSGDCRLSAWLDGRSADRGDCIQACRSRYDLTDEAGKVLQQDRPLLSLKDLNLIGRLEDLADAGVSSFKIEGRLKGLSYVRNTVRAYSEALDALVARFPERYRRASFGSVSGAFTPDLAKTFNRGYTELWLDGRRRGGWASEEAASPLGEPAGTVRTVRPVSRQAVEIRIQPVRKDLELHNGDGFSFAGRRGVTGFRGDLCTDDTIQCKPVDGLRPGLMLYRNIDAAFEHRMEAHPGKRELSVRLCVHVGPGFSIDIHAETEDGRSLDAPFKTDLEKAENRERAEAMIREQLSKRSGHYIFKVDELSSSAPGAALPLLSAGTLNSVRRLVAEDLDRIPCGKRPMRTGTKASPEAAGEALSQSRPGLLPDASQPLMRSRYCVRFELGLCPNKQGARPDGTVAHAQGNAAPLLLHNNGRRLRLDFDCRSCEMTVWPDR